MPSTDTRDALEHQLREAATFLRHCRGTEPAEFFAEHAASCKEAADFLAISAPEERAHRGDPCIYCGTPHDEVAVGDCPGHSAPEERRERERVMNILGEIFGFSHVEDRERIYTATERIIASPPAAAQEPDEPVCPECQHERMQAQLVCERCGHHESIPDSDALPSTNPAPISTSPVDAPDPIDGPIHPDAAAERAFATARGERVRPADVVRRRSSPPVAQEAKPSKSWIHRMADLEDQYSSISVGGLAVDAGLYVAPPVAEEDPTGHAPDCEWHVQRETWICHPSCDLHPAYLGVAQEPTHFCNKCGWAGVPTDRHEWHVVPGSDRGCLYLAAPLVPPAPPVAQGAEQTLDDELHTLHDRLRDEGRDADADLIDRAGWAMEGVDAELAEGSPLITEKRGHGPVPQGLPRKEAALYLWNLAQGSKSISDYLPSALAHLHTLEQMAALARPVAGSEERGKIASAIGPVVRRIQREVEDARNRGGMQAGLPRVTLDLSHVEHLLRAIAALRGEEVQDV